jgi:hypothetical protein
VVDEIKGYQRSCNLRDARLVVGFLIAVFVTLSALVAAIPPTEPYSQDGNPAMSAINAGDTGIH